MACDNLNKCYVSLQGWMVDDLGLAGHDLIIYAIIYGFSQDGHSRYNGGISYLSRWTGRSSDTIRRSLKDMAERGLIFREEVRVQGVTFVNYTCNLDFRGVPANCGEGSQNSATPSQNSATPSQDAAQNINNKYKININNTLSTAHARGKFIIPTLEEVAEYCASRHNGIDAQHFIDYYESNGWKVGRNPMQDWKATIRTWELRDKQNPSPRPSPRKQETSVAAWAEDMYRKIHDTYGK